MLLLRNIPIEFSRRDILRYLGFKPLKSSSNPLVDSLVEEAIEAARIFMRPAAILHTLITETVYPDKIVFRDSWFNLTGREIVGFMSRCPRVSLIAATIGADIEEEISRLFEAEDSSGAVALDAASSDAVEQAVTWAAGIIEREAEKQGFITLQRVSPGYGLWNIEANADIVKLLDAEKIGIEVLPSFELLPRKSVVAAVGWIPRET